ncbi:MAG TPA: hypothetical protein VLI54_03010 [Bacillota bacterium]|nr:hypothetical protein [Bacillota bacterium]
MNKTKGSAQPVPKIDLRPNGEQRSVDLGTYDDAHMPLGFIVTLDRVPHPLGSVITKVDDLGTAQRHRFVLQIANYSTQPVHASIRPFFREVAPAADSLVIGSGK